MSKITRITLIEQIMSSLKYGIVSLTDTDDQDQILRAYYTTNAEFTMLHGGQGAYNKLTTIRSESSADRDQARPFAYNILKNTVEQITPTQFTGFAHHVASMTMMDAHDINEMLGIDEDDDDFDFDNGYEDAALNLDNPMVDCNGVSASLLHSQNQGDHDAYFFVVSNDDGDLMYQVDSYGCDSDEEQVIMNKSTYDQMNNEEELPRQTVAEQELEEKEGYILLSEVGDALFLEKEAKPAQTKGSDRVFPAIACYLNNKIADIVILAN